MAPGYARRHARILGARLECNYWDGSLAGGVELVTLWPKALRQSIEWMQQADRGWWHDSDGLSDAFSEPGDEDYSKRPICSLRPRCASAFRSANSPARRLASPATTKLSSWPGE
jgi:hypothetical protein